MFLDEARIAVRLSHPNVVRTYRVAFENDGFFIIMEFLQGPTLQQLRRRAAPYGGLPLRFELLILSQALKGLQYAHELTDVYGAPLRIVHRDFTPQNIIVTHEGCPKVLDFGIAKAADSAVQTRAGMYKGKLSYMPPEQLAGRGVDQRADLFAAGVMLYQALTGKSLWEGADSNVIIRQLAAGELPPLKRLTPAHAPELVDLCRQALSPRPETRIGSAQEMRRVIDAYAHFVGFQVGPAELARYVDSLFGSSREAQTAIIQVQLARRSELPLAQAAGTWVGLPRLTDLALERRAPSAPQPPSEPDTASSDVFNDFDVDLTGNYPLVERRWVRWAVAAALAVATLLTFVTVRSLLLPNTPAPSPARRVDRQPPQTPVSAPRFARQQSHGH
jgi:serine/threonine-protein kinase